MKKGIMAIAFGGIVGVAIYARSIYLTEKKTQTSLKNLSDKHKDLFLMMNQWVKVKQSGKDLSAYFEKNGYMRVAIYGMGFVGETLLNELRGTQVQVAYGIDKNAETIYADAPVITVDEPFEQVDVIVVTAISYFDEIRESVSKKVSCEIVSLENILYSL